MQSEKRLFLILIVVVPLILLTLFYLKFSSTGEVGEPSFYPSKQTNDAAREYI